ncbi:hypothetical protein BH11PSE14_BH11PSE14_11180 [soil metagenome]
MPWLLALDATNGAWGALRSGLWMSVAFLAAAFGWFGFAVAEFTGLPTAVSLLILLVAAPLLQPQLIVFALVRQLVGRRHGRLLRALAGASAWVATEWLAPKLLGDTLGYGLYPSRLLRQFAEFGGAAGITFVLLLVNESVAGALARRRDGVHAVLRPLALGASLLALMAAYGATRLHRLDAVDTTSPPTPLLRVGMVQSNIVDYERLRREKGAYAVVREVLDTHHAMSREAVGLHQVDALLWSETVYPTTFGHPKSADGAALDRELTDFVASAGVPLVFGTYDLDANGEYNAAAFLDPGADKALGYYRKTDLFPLTEYVPRWLDGPRFRRWFPWTGTWQRGDGARVFPLRLPDGREIPVLPLICLDDVDTGLSIDGARLGAQVIIGMSNDSWFTTHPAGARLHLAVAAFRSIETRLPQLRVTADGVSAVIDASGTVLASTAIGERKLLVGEVRPAQPDATRMVAWGNWVGRAGLVFLLGLGAMVLLGSTPHRGRASIPTAAQDGRVADAFAQDVVVPLRGWRLVVVVLRVAAGIAMAWMVAAALRGDAVLANPLAQMRWFAVLVLVPQTLAWLIGRVTGVACPPQSDAIVAPTRPAWLAAIVLAHARVRRAVPSTMLDRPLIRFVLFPLVPALPAFRLHQHIAFGGTFGEYQSFGLQAYLTTFAIWWAGWAISLVLLAAALRLLIEAGALGALVFARGHAVDTRRALESLGRLIFYLGVPAWLLIRLWP